MIAPGTVGDQVGSSPARPLVCVGFSFALLGALSDQEGLPPVWVVEEPDVIAKRGLSAHVANLSAVERLVPARYLESDDYRDVVDWDAVAPVGVVPGLEYGVRAAAELAAQCGLPGAGSLAAEGLRDKILLRTRAAAAGLSNPNWREVDSAASLAAAAAAIGAAQLVLKPASSQGSLGVRMIDPTSDLDEAWRSTSNAADVRLLPDRPLQVRHLVEERIHGHEVSAECLVADGEIVFANLTDKLVAAGSYPVELGHDVPGPRASAHCDALLEAMATLVSALDFGTGILHGEWILTDGGPVLVECAGRIPGDHIVDLISHAHGFSLAEAYVRLLCGELVDFPVSPVQVSVVRFLSAAPGRVESIGDLEQVRLVPGIVDAGLDVRPGDAVGELRSSWDRCGHVMAVGRTAVEAALRADEAAGLMAVRTRA